MSPSFSFSCLDEAYRRGKFFNSSQYSDVSYSSSLLCSPFSITANDLWPISRIHAEPMQNIQVFVSPSRTASVTGLVNSFRGGLGSFSGVALGAALTSQILLRGSLAWATASKNPKLNNVESTSLGRAWLKRLQIPEDQTSSFTLNLRSFRLA